MFLLTLIACILIDGFDLHWIYYILAFFTFVYESTQND